MLTIGTVNDKGVLAVTAAGKLTGAEYETGLAQVEKLLDAHGTLRFLIRMDNVSGVEPSAVWQEMKFDLANRSRLGRTAVVGDRKWEEWMTRLSAPFFPDEVRYFDAAEDAEAQAWVNQP
jgi:hypothetical protein